tara:strand:+ start:1128 stop:2054 length:927 start_codon:yes stop_codon:yes gene_type:complete
MLVIIVHETFVRRVFIQHYQFYKIDTKSIICNLLLALVSSSVLTLYGYEMLFQFLKPEYQVDVNDLLASMFFGLFLLTIFISVMSYAVETFQRNSAYEKKQQELEKSVLKIEIEHLRNQLTPHFTFNILNNLQFLIIKDKNEALELLSRYSKILKYYIYESENKFIKLEDEITFLKYYFQLEKEKSDETMKVDFTIHAIPENQLVIIPFLLSTFFENAFKHVAPNEDENYIQLQISVDNEAQLKFEIENTFAEISDEVKKTGIGLEQAIKRLELSYPKNYELHQEAENGIYKVKLQLNLSKSNEVYRS